MPKITTRWREYKYYSKATEFSKACGKILSLVTIAVNVLSVILLWGAWEEAGAAGRQDDPSRLLVVLGCVAAVGILIWLAYVLLDQCAECIERVIVLSYDRPRISPEEYAGKRRQIIKESLVCMLAAFILFFRKFLLFGAAGMAVFLLRFLLT